MASINEFISGFKGGTRVNRFLVNTSSCPFLGSGDIEIHIRATSFPQMSITPYPLNFKGKTVNIPAVRTFQPWVITILDDINPGGAASQDLHKKFINWSNHISPTNENFGVSRLPGAINSGKTPSDDTVGTANVWTVSHLDHAPSSTGGEVLKFFKMYNCWPIEVSPIQLDMNQDAQMAMFNVTMSYTHLNDQ